MNPHKDSTQPMSWCLRKAPKVNLYVASGIDGHNLVSRTLAEFLFGRQVARGGTCTIRLI